MREGASGRYRFGNSSVVLRYKDRPDRRQRPRDVSDRGEDDVNLTSCVAVYGPRLIAAVLAGSGPADGLQNSGSKT